MAEIYISWYSNNIVWNVKVKIIIKYRPSYDTNVFNLFLSYLYYILWLTLITELLLFGTLYLSVHLCRIQYIPRNMHTVFALLCFVVVIHWLIFPYPSGLLHWHCGNLTIAPVPAKQPWWIWINTSCEFIMCDCITTTKQSTAKPCAYFLGYTVYPSTPLHHYVINYVM